MDHPDTLNALRAEAEIHHVDYTRARISRTNDGGFRVTFARPRFDCGPFLPTAPTAVECVNAYAAEKAMLRGLINLERAERRAARMGIVGWSGDQIAHRPLSEAEVIAHQARLRHTEKVAALRKELAEALEHKAKLAQADAGVAELNERYHLETPAPSAPTRKPVGRPRKHQPEAVQHE